MPRSLYVAVFCAALMIAGFASAQSTDESGAQTDEHNFNLKPSGGTARVEEVDDAPDYEPVLPERNLETSVTLGFWNLSSPLLTHDSLIYKYTDEFTYYGDVEIKGESAFHPQMSLSYNLTSYLSLEPFFDISVSEYASKITDPKQSPNSTEGGEPQPVEEIGEFDFEKRSNITVGTGMNVVLYPHNYGNFGKGNWHPFLIGGMSKVWMSINSSYVDDAASMWRYSGGAGIRYIADDMISVRFEMLFHRMTVQFDPAESYVELNEGLLQIPVYEYVVGEGARSVETFGEHTFNSMSWALGFTATF
jgi:hypothetical protein